MTNKIPPMPIDELLEICSLASDGKAWGVEAVHQKKKTFWRVFCSSKICLKRLPKTFRGRQVKIEVSTAPRLIKSNKNEK